jgi:hypothetical protein
MSGKVHCLTNPKQPAKVLRHHVQMTKSMNRLFFNDSTKTLFCCLKLLIGTDSMRNIKKNDSAEIFHGSRFEQRECNRNIPKIVDID